MSPTRREFLKTLGMALASLALTNCIPSVPLMGTGNSPRQRLRQCWLKLDWLTEQWLKGVEQGEQAENKLTADHRAALDDLVAAGELEAEVANLVQAIFVAAVRHVGPQVIVSCYVEVEIEGPTPTPTPTPTVAEVAQRELRVYIDGSTQRLEQQAALLAKMAERGNLEPHSVARAQAAIERDLTLLEISRTQTQVLVDEMVKAAEGSYDFPFLGALDLEIDPEAAAAARFLVDLLLEEQ